MHSRHQEHRQSPGGPHRAVFLLLLTWMLGVGTVSAKLVEIPLENLVKGAEVIVVGTVTSQRSDSDKKTIYTTTTVSVDEVIKGTVRGRVEIRTRGGALDGVVVHVPIEPEFSVGERVVVFLTKDGRRFRTAGHSQGKFSVMPDPVEGEAGDPVVVRNGGSFGTLPAFIAVIEQVP